MDTISRGAGALVADWARDTGGELRYSDEVGKRSRSSWLPAALVFVAISVHVTSVEAHHGTDFFEPRRLAPTDDSATTIRWLGYSMWQMIVASHPAVAPGHVWPRALSLVPAAYITKLVGAYLFPEGSDGIAARHQSRWSDPNTAAQLERELRGVMERYKAAEARGDAPMAVEALLVRNKLQKRLNELKVFKPDRFTVQDIVVRNGKRVAIIGARSYQVGDSIQGLYISAITPHSVEFKGWHVSLVRRVSR